ncbi:MAG: leucyl/phenylalanyl-tRNA--protein transferase [Capsulimonadales bacterium]|nr:leucyl/phenylalanyl-tRNA--protein transferase [Capsulimonadales bacterium]
MRRIVFPDPRHAGPEGIVAVGGDLRPETLLTAYRAGIFPWPHEGYPLLWFCPERRAILDFSELHIPESLAKARRKTSLTFSIDTAFEQVIHSCRSTPRPDQDGTWITPRMKAAYLELHRLGYAHSVEVRNEANELVGGLYGVSVDGVYSGESMFHRVSNASKLALLHLIDHLRDRGADFIDIQQLTPHMAALGAREIPREAFLDRWKAARARGLTLFDPPAVPETALRRFFPFGPRTQNGSS